MKLNASNVSFKDLNYSIKASRDKEIIVDNVLGQRYIGSGVIGKKIIINGAPGNALGAYLMDSTIIVNGSGQDATGDTMDSGSIIVYGNCGDTTGYAMRGGEIYIKGNAGYRVGIHMKEYANKIPVIVVGGKVGDFLGEYQAGGIIVVLGIGVEGIPVGAFCGTGMHGGKIYIRSSQIPVGLPKQVVAEKLENKKEVEPYVKKYIKYFGGNAQEILKDDFIKLYPNSKNPYKQLYTKN